VQAASSKPGGHPGSLAFSPGGRVLYAAAYDYGGAPQESALLAYSIDPTTGALARIDQWTAGVDGAASVAASPVGRHVYLAAYGEDAVLAFVPEPAAASAALPLPRSSRWPTAVLAGCGDGSAIRYASPV
jgi:6-phosphogluconolactonase (cycloisomerase 2 family)